LAAEYVEATNKFAEAKQEEETHEVAMKEYRYVILSSFGTSWDVSRDSDHPAGGFMQVPWYGDKSHQDLLVLLEKGWHPVRETAMGGANAAVAFSLILMERDRNADSVPA
jgi:hypothetical protein